jgi:hypothetical protein
MRLREKVTRLAKEKPELRKHLVPLLKKEAGSGMWPAFWIEAVDAFLRSLGEDVERVLKRGYGQVKLRQVGGGSGLTIDFAGIKETPPNFFHDPKDSDSPPLSGSIYLQMNHFEGLIINPDPGKTTKINLRKLTKANSNVLVSDVLDSVDLGRLL